MNKIINLDTENKGNYTRVEKNDLELIEEALKDMKSVLDAIENSLKNNE